MEVGEIVLLYELLQRFQGSIRMHRNPVILSEKPFNFLSVLTVLFSAVTSGSSLLLATGVMATSSTELAALRLVDGELWYKKIVEMMG